MTELNRNKVLLGLSGGVDSTTAALLLQNKGFEVIGYFFDVTGGKKGFEDAAKVSGALNIPLIYEDVSSEFKDKIINDFTEAYLNGRTPNPCVLCNPAIKFAHLAAKADELGIYHIATGHYANIDEYEGKYYIKRASNESKDQSYMLYGLRNDILKRVIFPLGDISDKEQTRTLAREYGMTNSDKKDSQEICFIDTDDNYINFIESRGYSTPKGNFVDANGKILGEHKGILHYTVGQRKGLGIALGRPAFVTKINPASNEITLGDNDDLFTDIVKSTDNFFTNGSPEEYDGKRVRSKVRYSAKLADASISVKDNMIITAFDEPQRAPTPGQSIVFYIDNRVIGGGLIHE